jgi:archaemetzincin
MIERIDFVALDGFPAGLATDLAARTSRHVPLACRVLRTAVAPPPALEGRTQVDADGALRALEALPVPRDTVVMGLTAHDIGSPLFAYFFGRARLNGRAGLVSTARLSPAFYGLPDDPALTLRRAEIEVLHELGHLLGLAHCRDFACLMHVSTDVETLDSRGTAFCPECARRLPPPLRPDDPR